ncbi:MAG: DinB family protein [Thermomicrobia bacterium]|nr:DinB family protein [Thermomicrobia bacterium]
MQEMSPTAPGAMGNNEIETIIKELRDAPEAFTMLFASESEETLHHRPAEGEWSAVEIVSHLADLDAFNRTERFNAILIEENPALPAYEPDARVMEANYQALTSADALSFLKRERELITVLLEGLRPHELARTGVHPQYGERALLQMADMRNHDRTHLDQVAAAIASAKG